MRPISAIDFGPSDAAAYDPHFAEKYVEPHVHERLLSSRYNVITGGKGSGKTALIRALHDIHQQKYATTVDVSFEDFSFAPVMEAVLEISHTSGVSDLSVMINHWKYGLVVEAMKQVVATSENVDPTVLKIAGFLKNEKHLDEVLSERLHGLADRQWRKLERATRPRRSESDYPGAVSADAISEAKNYPWRSKPFSDLVGDFEGYLEREGLRVLITLDGLDVLQVRGARDREQIKLVFEGLIAATYQLSTSRLGSHLVIKCMVPYDVYLDLNLRDQDKFAERCAKIEWDRDSLQEFLRKRLLFSLSFDRTVPFDRAWHEVMPNEVMNLTVGLPENSYEYLLRHTLYRPRHLQGHLRALAERFDGHIIRPEMVVAALHASTMELVQTLIVEHRMTHPRLREFLTHLRGKPNVMAYSEFRQTVARVLLTMNADYVSIETEIDGLYRLGVIGMKEEIHNGGWRGYRPPHRPGVAPYVCIFHHTRPNGRFTLGLRDDDQIVIHPIFYEYCEIRTTSEFIVG